MTEIYFYHLEATGAAEVLVDLLQRGLKRNLRMSVEVSDPEQVSELSQRLWAAEDVAFLPHGMAGDPSPERQPIWLACNGENPNASQFRFYVGGALPAVDVAYERASVLFDGADEAQLAAARQLWRNAKAQGCEVKYWKRDDTGRWADLASRSQS